MNGIEKIAARIEADAAAEIEAINAETEAKCAAIMAEAEAKAAEVYAQRMAKGRADCELRAQRLGATADMESRKAILAFKQSMISEIFDKAVEAILTLPREEYVEFLASQAAAASSSGYEELVFAPCDRPVADAAAKRANAILKEMGREAHLSVSADDADIPGGLILRQGDIEVNCAADTLVAVHRNRLASSVAGILFN